MKEPNNASLRNFDNVICHQHDQPNTESVPENVIETLGRAQGLGHGWKTAGTGHDCKQDNLEQ